MILKHLNYESKFRVKTIYNYSSVCLGYNKLEVLTKQWLRTILILVIQIVLIQITHPPINPFIYSSIHPRPMVIVEIYRYELKKTPT